MLRLTGRSLTVGGGTVARTFVYINGNPCNITSMTNTYVDCQLGHIEAGNHTVTGIINGTMFFCINNLM